MVNNSHTPVNGSPKHADTVQAKLDAANERLERIERALRVRDVPTLLTVDEAATALSVSPRTVRSLLAGGELQTIKIKRCTRISAASLGAYVRRQAA